ncbi:helix-turn-helix domain-containing protein [Devosia sp. WQ 349]|uniref:helix-turn-helix transcriptional regulator n=1 Tax=Devosia sp. WQ 349K1 TaxID=2800329 RepID=UPI001907CBB6|nr:helix-turn-helix domain-containing protein [Devosia sp. WQ 349K1]MBK1793546.1 helix-turn-helix domain-containing protein [Devosia sp. WQ 349K1]
MNIRVRAAAEYVGLSKSTLDKHRHYGTGPRYYKLGRSVVYAVSDLDAWLVENTRTGTWSANDNRANASQVAA